jgi:hypothetical protein
VQSDPHADRACRERLLRGSSRREPIPRRPECDEEGIALRVDLDPAVARERLAEDAAVLLEEIAVRRGTELVQQLRRALDVGEEKRDGAGG